MDVSKAKSIIIVLLIAFNLFLLSNNLFYLGGQGEQKVTVKNAEVILKQRGVTLECSIPVSSDSYHRLEYGNGEINRAEVTDKLFGNLYDGPNDGNMLEYQGKRITFDNSNTFIYSNEQPASNFDIRSGEKARKTALAVLNELDLLNGKYVADKLMYNQDDSVTVVFLEQYEGFLLYDNYCSVTMTGRGIVRIEYKKLQVKGFTAKKVEHLQAYQALLAHFKIGSNDTITSIDSGYKLDETSVEGLESVELLPVWRIQVKGGSKPLYLSSYSSVE